MYQSIAAVGIDQQPRDGANPALAIFFVVFIVFGGFFVLQLFVATTIEKVGLSSLCLWMLPGLHAVLP